MTALSHGLGQTGTSKIDFRVIVSAVIIFVAVTAGSSGATYFALENLTGISLRDPNILYVALAGLLILFFKVPPRDSASSLMLLVLLLGYFLLTSAWSPGQTYRDEKLLKTLIATPTMVIAGYIAVRHGGAKSLAWGFAAFAALISASVLMNGGLISSLELLLDSTSGSTLDYQRFGIIAGVGSAMLTPLVVSARRPWPYILVAAGLALLALMSGGRTGALMVIVAIASYMSWKVGLRTVLLVSLAAAGLLMIAFEPLLSTAIDFARSVGAPDTILRALIAAEAPPAVSRIWDRPDFLAGAIEVWIAHPLFGVGWGGYQVALGLPDHGGYYPHNLVFEVLAETGVVGFALLAICALHILRSLTRLSLQTIVERRDLAIIGTLLTCGVVSSMLMGDWWAQYTLFIASGAAIAFREACAKRNAPQ